MGGRYNGAVGLACGPPILERCAPVKRSSPALLAAIALLLAACGSYVPPAPARSLVEERQTAVALEGRPTLAPVTPGPTRTPGPPPPSLEEALQIRADDPRALGSPDAPVTIIEFTDFECPFCQQFFRDTRPQIVAQFVEAGIVRYVARDFPLVEIHPSALPAAIAAQCAADQGQYWPMYERLFTTHQEEWGGVPKRDRDVFVEFAADLGLEIDAFTTCLNDPAREQAVMAETNAAARLGISSTPNFLVNGQLLRGALAFRVFEDLIQQKAGS
ncbi:MAG: DsbA family protein [Chloroflexales bacterium]|nr:DsbA family protein [Chloroflexales bacterium]